MSWLFLLTLLEISVSINGRKNVLFILVDDLRPELNCYEGDYYPSSTHPTMHTPNIDELARRSLLLKRAYVQLATCNPSRASLLTGRRPDTMRLYGLRRHFRKSGGNFTTLPQYFKMSGYITAGMGKVFHIRDNPSWSLPFYWPANPWRGPRNSWSAIPDDLLKDKPTSDEQVARKASQTLRLFSKGGKFEGKPFFIAAGFYKPHLPFVFPQSYLSLYPEDQVKLPNNSYAPSGMPECAWSRYTELISYPDIKKLNVSGSINTTLPDRNVLALRRAYYCAVSYIDDLIGKLIKDLDDLGFRNNTIISFLGDHGFHLGEHGEWCKHNNFELSTHAPLMVHIPGMTDEGIDTAELTEFVDLFPTIVEAAGLEPVGICPEDSRQVQTCVEGQSLMPLINRTTGFQWKKAAFSQYPRYRNRTRVMGYTVRTDRFRYTEWPELPWKPNPKPNWNRMFGVELYDHQIDPDENKNRAFDPSYHAEVASLSKTLRDGWRAAIPNGSL